MRVMEHTVFMLNNQNQVEMKKYNVPEGKPGRYKYEAKLAELKDLKVAHQQATGGQFVEISSANRLDANHQPSDVNRWGNDCSAMNLNMHVKDANQPNGEAVYKLENVFQSSKKFERSGSHEDWLKVSPFQAKSNAGYVHNHDHEKITGFEFAGHQFPGDPHSLFYNFIYARALCQKPNRQLANQVCRNNAFSDIYSHAGQDNSQAQACAIVSALNQRGQLKQAISSVDNFKKAVYDSDLLADQKPQTTYQKPVVKQGFTPQPKRPVVNSASVSTTKKPLVDTGLEF